MHPELKWSHVNPQRLYEVRATPYIKVTAKASRTIKKVTPRVRDRRFNANYTPIHFIQHGQMSPFSATREIDKNYASKFTRAISLNVAFRKGRKIETLKLSPI